MNWQHATKSIKSLGQTTEKIGTLAGLHIDRTNHSGQFFTTDAIARYMWELVAPSMDNSQRYAIMDNSVGNGQLLQFCNPEQHVLLATDIDERLVQALSSAADKAGFTAQIKTACMSDTAYSHASIALINPPFSLRLKSPHLEPYDCTSDGMFGPNTSALSHEYALEQALNSAGVVCAVLPSRMRNKIMSNRYSDRLRLIARCASNTFEAQNATVSTIVALWDAKPRRGDIITTTTIKAAPQIELSVKPLSKPANLKIKYFDTTKPSITLPATGDKVVKIAHSGRQINLCFQCGFTQAVVLNKIYRATAKNDGFRLANGVKYVGQGVLDVQTHLIQDDPIESIQMLASQIEQMGFIPRIDNGLMQYIKRQIKIAAKKSTPLRHSVFIPAGTQHGMQDDKITIEAKKKQVLDNQSFGSPILNKGETLTAIRCEKGYSITKNNWTVTLSPESLDERFTVQNNTSGNQWKTLHQGRIAAFPEQAAQLKQKALSLGIHNFLSWNFQLDDLVEAKLTRGLVISWQQALGKTRLAGALCLMGGDINVIAVEAHLIAEMVSEFKQIPELSDNFQVIRSVNDLQTMKKINIVSYNRLKMPINPGSKRTISHLLRRRVHTVVADECHLLKNRKSQQSRAIFRISPKCRYGLTGTVISNYPRDTLPIITWANGDSVVGSHYSFYRHTLFESNRYSLANAKRGIQDFAAFHVELEWSTHQFKEELTEGAKREVPKIKNLNLFRDWACRNIKRRVQHEPDVRACVTFKKPDRENYALDWDDRHLLHYLNVAEDFASWFKQQRKHEKLTGAAINNVALLARINAVQLACTFPQMPHEKFGAYLPLTTKQQHCIDQVQSWVDDGHKTIVYARNPEHLEFMAKQFNALNIKTTLFHGQIPIIKRNKVLDEEFRNGDSMVLLSSINCGQKGLNLPQASRIYLLESAWTHTIEEQIEFRVLRAAQTKQPIIGRAHITGSIDDYMAQMNDFKKEASLSGIDYATPTKHDDEFLHIDHILYEFCEHLAMLRNYKGYRIREQLSLSLAS